MNRKERHNAPKCEGRFGELRSLFYETAREFRELYDNPLWTIRNYKDFEAFVDWLFEDDINMTSLYDVIDPYFGNKRDILRGDPLVGDPKNWKLSLIPFVFEGMR